MRGHLPLLGWRKGGVSPERSCDTRRVGHFLCFCFICIFPPPFQCDFSGSGWVEFYILATCSKIWICALMKKKTKKKHCDVQCKVFFLSFLKNTFHDCWGCMDRKYKVQAIQCLLFDWWVAEVKTTMTRLHMFSMDGLHSNRHPLPNHVNDYFFLYVKRKVFRFWISSCLLFIQTKISNQLCLTNCKKKYQRLLEKKTCFKLFITRKEVEQHREPVAGALSTTINNIGMFENRG